MTVSSQESTMRITSIAVSVGAATSVTRSSTSSYSRRGARHMVACISYRVVRGAARASVQVAAVHARVLADAGDEVGDDRPEPRGIVDGLCPGAAVPALRDREQPARGFEDAARHARGFAAREPGDDRRDPARMHCLAVGLARLPEAQVLRHPRERAWRD